MTKGMTRGWFRDACLANRNMHSPLEHLLVGMVPPDHAGARVTRYLGGGEHVLPPPGTIRVGIFALQGIRKVDSPCSGLEIPGMQHLDVLEMLLSGPLDRLRQHRDPIFLPFAVPYHDLIVGKIQVFDPQA